MHINQAGARYMNDAVEPVTPIFVHQVALTSICVTDDDGDWALFPVIGVWADLTPLRAGGVDFSEPVPGVFPVVVMTDSVLDATNAATMTVLLAQAHNSPDREPDSEEFDVSPFGPRWSVQLPTAWVGMSMAVMGSPLQMRIVMLDGQPPANPESHMLSTGDAGVVVLPTTGGVQETLGQAMGVEWTVPVPMQPMHTHGVPEINLMRDQFWAAAAGLALGQERALNKLVSIGEYVATLNGGDVEEQTKYDMVMQVAEWVNEASQLEPLPRDNNGHVVWANRMAGLSEKIDAVLDDTILDSVDRGLPFDDAVEAYGAKAAMTALGVLVAARAHSAVNDDDAIPGRFTPAYMLGVWLDEDSDDPWWATRATHHLLLHHDTDVLTNLLACNPRTGSLADGHGPLTMRYLHVLAEALVSLGLSVDDFTDRVKQLDVTPANTGDIVYVAQRMIGTCVEVLESGREECACCAAVAVVVSETMDQHRLVSAAVNTLPMLADLAAAMQDLSVGDEDWKTHRESYLMHWMNHTAIQIDQDA